MKKIIKVILLSICAAFLILLFLSWIDIIADNNDPNPHHSKYNAFVIMTKQEEQAEGACGNPITGHTRIETGIPMSIDGNILTLVTLEDGAEWTVEIGDSDNFSMDDYLCVFFDDMGTEEFDDDTIVKIWKEVW